MKKILSVLVIGGLGVISDCFCENSLLNPEKNEADCVAQEVKKEFSTQKMKSGAKRVTKKVRSGIRLMGKLRRKVLNVLEAPDVRLIMSIGYVQRRT